MNKKISNYQDFYLYYLNEHKNATCRALHIIGTSLALFLLFYSLITMTWWLLALVLPLGYGFAWIGHFFFEKNKPATFTYPLWSFASDFVLLWHFLTGQLREKYQIAEKEKDRLLKMS